MSKFDSNYFSSYVIPGAIHSVMMETCLFPGNRTRNIFFPPSFSGTKAAWSPLLPITLLPYWQRVGSLSGMIWRLYPESVSQALLCCAAEHHWGTFTDSTELVNYILAFRQKFTEWHLSNWRSFTTLVHCLSSSSS